MANQVLSFSCSPEQEDIIADHLLFNGELGILPDEKAWILAQSRKRSPGCKVVGAELVVEYAEWQVTIEPQVTT